MKHRPSRLIWLLGVLLISALIGSVLWLYSDWITDKSVLTDAPCAPPCWQGIQPGTHMSRDEVLRRLRAMPNVGSSWQPTATDIAWYWRHWPWKEAVVYNEIQISGDTIKQVNLHFDFSLTVEAVIGKYGIPEITYVAQGGVPEAPYEIVDLCYPTRGLTFGARTDWRRPVLQPATRVYSAFYEVPSQSLNEWLATHQAYYRFQLWPGYGPVQPLP